MPYQQGNRLPGEKASKLGHLQVIQSPLVQNLCKNFEDPDYLPEITESKWETFSTNGNKLSVIFSVDGSLQPVESPTPPYKSVAFVKTALLKIDQVAVAKIDKDNPHPFALRDLMQDAAIYHATAFPLRHVKVPGKTIYHAVREIIFESIKDVGNDHAIDGAMMETLKWLAYEKWSPNPKAQLEKFGCPHCFQNVASLPFDEEVGKCPGCGGELFITDLFGFHLSMTEDFAPAQVASDYMSVSETLLIFTPIRFFWDTKREILKHCLMVKDGPLSLRATLAKLAAPIRRFFDFAKNEKVEIAMIGQEKSGAFFDHLSLIGGTAPTKSLFIPNNNYIRSEVQHLNTNSVYGTDTNYGAKLFVKINDYHKMVLNIPTGKRGEFVEKPDISNLIAVKNILATLPDILSNRYEGALLPIELANGVASLSTYPSAKILEILVNSQSEILQLKLL